jgi:hypothetical protein
MHNTPHSEATRALISSKKRGVPLLAKRRIPRIVDGEELWKCPTCGRWLPALSYYKKKTTWNGISNQCRQCYGEGNIRTRDKEKHCKNTRESEARRRSSNPELFREKERKRPRRFGPKVDARQIVALALRIGALVRPITCEDCGQQKKLTGHHTDYKKPLDVQWLCYLCHAQRHRKK